MIYYLMNQQYGPDGAELPTDPQRYVQEPTAMGTTVLVRAVGVDNGHIPFQGTQEAFDALFTLVED